MNNDRKNNINIELILETLIVILISLFSRLGFGSLAFLIPAVACIFTIRHDFKKSIIALIIGLAAIILIDRFYGLMLLIQILPISLVFSYMVKLRRSPRDVIISSTIILFMSLLISLSLLTSGSELDFTKQFEVFLNNQLETQVKILENMDLDTEFIESFKTSQKGVYNYILQIFPSLLLLYSALIGYINYIISKNILRRIGLGIREIAPFSKFSVPSNFGIGIASVFVLTLLLRNIDGAIYDVLLVNLTAILSLIFVLQGLSVVDFFLKKRNKKKITRVIILAVIILFIPMLTPITIIGAIDMIFDVRKIRKPRNS